MTCNLDLQYSFLPLFEGGKATIKIAQIYIKRRTSSDQSSGYSLDYITPECWSIAEFDAEVDRLEDELKTIRQSARRAFSR
jgi:hypothetical protein